MREEIRAIPDVKVIDPKYIPHVLKEGELGAALEWSVWDPKTGALREHKVKKSESYVRGFFDLLYMQFTQNGWTSGSGSVSTIPIRDTGNTVRNTYLYGTFHMRTDALADDFTYGVVVGTGVGAPTINDYQLGTIISHGSGAGELQYSAVTWGAPASDATTSQMTITRNFANASGGDITVNEIGLYMKSYDGANRYFCVIRDKIDGGITVPDGQTLTINYRLQATI